jgi:hypothetical protein
MTTTTTPAEFRTLHGDPVTWTVADFDERQILDDIAAATSSTCWFCAAENPANYTVCGFCNNRRDNGPS